MYKRITYLLPRRFREYIEKQVKYAGMKEEFGYRFVGFGILFSIFLTLVIIFNMFFILDYGIWSFLVGGLAGSVFVFISTLSFSFIADSKAREVEKVLPDALQLIAANVRAGMTIDKAIWLSARPEFGLLEEEIRLVGAKTVGGTSMKNALIGMTKRIKSEVLERTVRLINEGIESGGELAFLLEETANNIRTNQSLRKEIRSSVTTYSIFILFAAVIGAPMLFAISLFFVEVMGSLWTPQIFGAVSQAGGPIGGLVSGTAPQITVDELFWFAIACMITTTFFGALIIGLIQYGKESRGLKYLPLLMVGAIVVFFVARFFIGILFGQFFSL